MGRGRGRGRRVPYTSTCWQQRHGCHWSRQGHGGSGDQGCAHTQTKGWPCPAARAVPAMVAVPTPLVQVSGMARDRGAATGCECPPCTLPNPLTVTHGCDRADGTWAGAGPREAVPTAAVPGHRSPAASQPVAALPRDTAQLPLLLPSLFCRWVPSGHHHALGAILTWYPLRTDAAHCHQLWVSPHSAALSSRDRGPQVGDTAPLQPGRTSVLGQRS